MIKGSKAIVTGGSRGIGYGIARKLAAQGVQVVITGRKLKALEEAAATMEGTVYSLAWDMSDLEETYANFEKATELMGGFDILVNNAGVITPQGEWDEQRILSITPEDWDYVMDVNTRSLFFSSQWAVKKMIAEGTKGNILNITSVAAFEPGYGPYGASKAAALSLTRGWGKTFAAKGITINGIAPGPIATEMNDWHEGDPMEHPRIPYGRFGTIDEVADLAMYLLSAEAAYLCGETVVCDGAYHIR